MSGEDFQLNQIRRNDIAGGHRVAGMKLRHAGRNDTALFRVAHDRIAKIFRCRIGRFDLPNDFKNLFALFG